MERHGVVHPGVRYDECGRAHKLVTCFVKSRDSTGVPVTNER